MADLLLRGRSKLKNQRDVLLEHMNRPIKRSSPCLKSLSLGNNAFHGSLMFERNRVSRSISAIDGGAGDLGAYYPQDPLMFGGRNRASRALAAVEASLMGQGSYGMMMSPKPTSDLPLDLASMVKIYGSVNLMGKDQIGCRFLQKLVDEGLFVDALFIETINHVVELSMDPFGNYLVQKLLDACVEEQRTMIVSVLTSRPTELLKICLNNYG